MAIAVTKSNIYKTEFCTIKLIQLGKVEVQFWSRTSKETIMQLASTKQL
jgi:hypothetical protein